ncbi:hypothetical protein ACWD4F_02945 [Streptomyces aureus]|uniref:hypothetical protein n=1 Tax=Streptomyces aureus TaxID=193461 RepID=UPI000A9CA49D
MSSTRNPSISSPYGTGVRSPEGLDVSGVTAEGAAWLASAGAYPRSTLALWRERPDAPVILLCGSAFDVVSTSALFGRRMLDRLWDEGPGSGPVAAHRGRILLFAAPGTAQRLPSLMEWEEWGTDAPGRADASPGLMNPSRGRADAPPEHLNTSPGHADATPGHADAAPGRAGGSPGSPDALGGTAERRMKPESDAAAEAGERTGSGGTGRGAHPGSDAAPPGGYARRGRQMPPLLCHGTGDAITVPPPCTGAVGPAGARPDSRWLVAPDTRQPWLPGPEILLWAAVRAARAAASAAVRISIFPRADQDAKVYDVSRRR